MRRAPLMVFPLMFDVVDHFRKGSFPKADDAISVLPLQGLWLHAMVDVPRTGPLQISNPIANQKGWWNPHSEVDVILDAPNGVHLHTGAFREAVKNCVCRMNLIR